MTGWVLVAVLGILSIAVCLMAAGLVEVYAELVQVRSVLRLQDQPTHVELPTVGQRVVDLIPEPPHGLVLDGSVGDRYVLVLSTTCSVCRTIGEDLVEHSNDWSSGLAIMVASDTERAGREFVAAAGLQERCPYVDHLGQYARQLGIDQSPTVLRIRDGRLEAAASLTSLNQLAAFVGVP